MAVFFTTQAVVMQSLRDQLLSRAIDESHHFVGYLAASSHPPDQHAPNQPPSGQTGQRRPAPPPPGFFEADKDTGGVYISFADQRLKILGSATGPFGKRLPDPTAARRTLTTAAARYSTQQTQAGHNYLIYSMPITFEGRIRGVIQTSVSENQYRDSLSGLLRVLLAVGAAGLLAAAAISAVLVRHALQPIRASLRRQRDFVADAAHELRTPLTIMRTAAELGLSSANTTEQQVALEQTLVQSNHLTRLVDDLSLLARSDSGAVSVERAPVDLARLVAETVEGVDILAEDRGVRLTSDLRGQTRVLGDAGRLRQLLMILLDNALKHTPEGGTVTVRAEPQGHRARLQVRDSGPGIDPQDLPHLFDRFYRADRARAGEGTGLGLSIARWIAEAHGGHIVAANADQGATFTVTLPLAS